MSKKVVVCLGTGTNIEEIHMGVIKTQVTNWIFEDILCILTIQSVSDLVITQN